MCFSASASFIAAGALIAVGGATLRLTTTKAQKPLAAMPLLFGIQQFAEGVVWISFGYPSINWAASHLFILFSHVVWPILFPYAVFKIETEPTRRHLLRGLMGIGLGVGLFHLLDLATTPLGCEIVNHSILYTLHNPDPVPAVSFYMIVTCLSFIISSHKRLQPLGYILAMLALITYLIYSTTFVSVWCFTGAIVSSLIYFYFYKQRTKERLLDRSAR